VKAVVYEGVGSVAVREVPDATVETPSDAVIRVTTAAICGSDLHFFHGKAPLYPGDTIGHEAVGVVENLGADVSRFSVGQRVVVAFDIACGTCWFCKRGQTQLCEDFANLGAGMFGGGLGGAQAELVRVPHADFNLLAVPEGMEDERAIFVGDVLTTGYYGASIAGIREGDTVAVVGAGPVGYLCARSAVMRGAAKVVVLDREAERLALVTGASPAIVAVNVDEQNPHMALSEATDGRGADVAIEAAGNPEAFDTALDAVRRGGIVCVVGMFSGEQVEAPLGVWWARALDIRFAGICPVHAWWEETMGHVEAGRIDPTPLISHALSLDEAVLGYELFSSRRATKVLLKP
jgi:2-desacetyl-2-hydroxyethyl bacteriochlorophyllide A dehydrogenase